jgi:predicted transposase/invertase (TIGR01784 family)
VKEFDMLAEKDTDLKHAVDRLKEISTDEQARMMYEARLKVARDRYAVESSMREQGRHEGRQEGQHEGRVAVARNLIELGIPVEKIIQATGLSAEEIRELMH